MKKIIILIITIFSVLLNGGSIAIESGSKASQRAAWNFELSNKANAISINVTLKIGNEIILNKEIPNGGKLRAALNNQLLSLPLTLIIKHGANSIGKPFVAQLRATSCVRIKPNGNCENKIFLTFECQSTFFSNDAKLRPQQGIGGILSGLIKTSESGISLQYNIRQDGIQRIQ